MVVKMDKRIQEVVQLSKDMGLDFFDIIFNVVENSTMFDLCSYALPIRARHWSYGRSYDYQKTYGEMGFSKVYEIILNNNPSHAFMLDTNTETENLFIAAHCCGHSHFFKNNYLFKNTNRNMIRHAAEHAGRVDKYIDKYGFEEVEHLMDVAFSLSYHIDWKKGLHRKRYSPKKIVHHKQKRGEFDDLWYKKQKPTIIKRVINDKFPPHPEKDLLWFFTNYAPLEDWEKDVLDIVREEMFYFYPQIQTKILNEGFAVFWHARIMREYLNGPEYIDFLKVHEKVVQPGGNPFRINPYYLGFKIFSDIEKRWDEKYGKGEGVKMVLEVAKNEDDVSFLRNYLTSDLVEKLKLFTYGYSRDYDDSYNGVKTIEIKNRMREEVIEALAKPLYNCGYPVISIVDISSEGHLIMRHDSTDMGTLDHKFAAKTLEYIWYLWAAPIELHIKDEGKNVVLCYDEGGFSEKNNHEMEEDEESLIILP
jgi:stage V sporulation protein R